MNNYRYILPNTLTAGRLVLAGLLPFCDQKYWLVIVLAAAGSDLVDGWLARRWQAVSWQGGLLDAVADKVFTLAILLVFVADARISLWWMPFLLLRELVVGATAAYLACNRLWLRFRDMSARLAGKAATASQFALAITVLIAPGILLPVLLLTSLLSALAALDYWRLFQGELRRRQEKGRQDRNAIPGHDASS